LKGLPNSCNVEFGVGQHLFDGCRDQQLFAGFEFVSAFFANIIRVLEPRLEKFCEPRRSTVKPDVIGVKLAGFVAKPGPQALLVNVIEGFALAPIPNDHPFIAISKWQHAQERITKFFLFGTRHARSSL
jgi:hypothetical protein